MCVSIHLHSVRCFFVFTLRSLRDLRPLRHTYRGRDMIEGLTVGRAYAVREMAWLGARFA